MYVVSSNHTLGSSKRIRYFVNFHQETETHATERGLHSPGTDVSADCMLDSVQVQATPSDVLHCCFISEHFINLLKMAVKIIFIAPKPYHN